jgi:hypothetical protein
VSFHLGQTPPQQTNRERVTAPLLEAGATASRQALARSRSGLEDPDPAHILVRHRELIHELSVALPTPSTALASLRPQADRCANSQEWPASPPPRRPPDRRLSTRRGDVGARSPRTPPPVPAAAAARAAVSGVLFH